MDTKFVSLVSGIRQIQPTSPPLNQQAVAGNESARAAGKVENESLVNEKAGPSARNAEESGNTEPATLDQVVEQLNRNIQHSTRALKFTIDDRQGKPVVSVVDKETDEVIRQIPSEVALHVADALEEVAGALVSEHA